MNNENISSQNENEVIVDFPGKAKKKKPLFSSVKRSGAKLSPVATGIVIAIVLVVIYLIADLSSGGFVYNVNGRFRSVFTKNSSESFLVETNADSVFGFESHGNGFMILTENGVSFVDKNGEFVSGQQLVYSSPAADINGDNIAFYDKGNTSYTLTNNGKVYSQQKLDNRIIDLAVSKNNNYAMVLRDENSKTILVGCNSKGNVIYQWNCPNGFITDVAINDKGNKVVASVLNSVNAVLSSSVYILDFEYNTEYALFDYPGETVVGAKFLSDKKIQIITDKNVYRISGKNQSVSYEFGTQDIYFADSSEKLTAVITKDYSHDNSYILTIINSNGKVKKSVVISGKVNGLSVSDKSIAVLFDDKIENYSKTGKLVGSIEDTKYYNGIVINKDFIFVLSSDSIRRFPAYGNMTYAPEIEEGETSFGGF